MILHQYHLSPFNQKVQRMLNHKGIPFEEKYWLLADLAVYGMCQALRDADMALAVIQEYPAVMEWMARVEETTGGVTQ